MSSDLVPYGEVEIEVDERRKKLERVYWAKITDGLSERAACAREGVPYSTFKRWKALGMLDDIRRELDAANDNIASVNQATAYHTLVEALPDIVQLMVDYVTSTSPTLEPDKQFQAQMGLLQAIKYLAPQPGTVVPAGKGESGEEEHLRKWSFEPDRHQYKVTTKEDGSLTIEVNPPKRVLEQEKG